jgi:hypothetical protein
MENIMNEANKIVNLEMAREKKSEVSTAERKNEAYEIIFINMAMAGLGMCDAKESEARNAVLDRQIGATSQALNDCGFIVKAKPSEFEAKCMMMLFTMSSEPAEKKWGKVREVFENLMWNKCVFQGDSQ